MNRKKSIFFLLGWNDYRIFQGISRFANQAEWRMDTRHFFLNIFPTDRTFDGMIAMYHTDPSVRSYVRRTASTIPTVMLAAQGLVVGAPMVRPDNQGAGRMAAQHLYGLFHKNYGWFACESNPPGEERKAAFEAYLSELGFSCQDISCGKSAFNGRTVIHKVKQCAKPIGVLARDDHDASVLIDLCLEAGIRVPQEVSVIGVGDLESLCAFSHIPTSSVGLNMEELGYQAAAVLDKLMQGLDVPSETVIPAGPVIQRASTGLLAITQPNLKTAIRTIDSRFQDSITMDHLAAIAGVSRRQLYKLFRKEMRCSPHDYIMDVRLRHAQKLLSGSDVNMTQVARECGFNTGRTLNRVFNRKFGAPPSKWAKQTQP